MSDKMMRLAGRGKDGRAKAIKTIDGYSIPSGIETIDLINNEEFLSGETKSFNFYALSGIARISVRWKGNSSDVDFDLSVEGKNETDTLYMNEIKEIFKNRYGNKNTSELIELDSAVNRLIIKNNQNSSAVLERLSITYYISESLKPSFTNNLSVSKKTIDKNSNHIFDFEFTKKNATINLRLVSPARFYLMIVYYDSEGFAMEERVLLQNNDSLYKTSYSKDFTVDSKFAKILVYNLGDDNLSIESLEITQSESVGNNDFLSVNHVNCTELSKNSTVVYFGYNIGNGNTVRIIDTQNYKNLFVKAKNNHEEDVALSLIALKNTKDRAGNNTNRIFHIDDYTLPSGNEKIWSVIDYPALSLGFGGLVLRASPVSSGDSGDFEFVVMGDKK